MAGAVAVTAGSGAPRGSVVRGGAFGLDVVSAVPLPGLDAPPAPGAPRVAIQPAGDQALRAAWSGAARRAEIPLGGGRSLLSEWGFGGDVQFRYGHACFHVTADGARILCAIPDPEAGGWRRVLLDSVLGTAALLRGLEGLHAGGVEIGGGVAALLGATGTGKSSLLAALVSRGHPLVSDDVIVLGRVLGTVVAHPGPAVMTLPDEAPDVEGEELERGSGERWIAPANHARGPLPVRALFVLDPGGTATGCERMPPSPVPVLEHSLRSGSPAGRLASRFALAGRLASSTPIHRLTRGDATPDNLATLVEETLDAEPVGGTA
jgi:hypothetical protein